MNLSKTTGDCPLLGVHARLDDLHTLWHEAVSHYQAPERFRTFLNAAIQAARNVTFVLQKQKESIPGFDTWYEPWRDRLKEDPVMRWIVEARNRVVKAGDLQVTSQAKVSIVAGYDDLPSIEMEVDPLLPLDAVADLVRRKVSEQWMKRHGTVIVERLWRVQDLKDRELLDALGHACGRLLELVYDAHLHLGIEASALDECPWPDRGDPVHAFVPDTQWVPACMKSPEVWRSVSVRIGSGERLKVVTHSAEQPREALEAAAERYGLAPPAKPSAGDTLRGTAEYFFMMAEIMLKRDGYHLPFAFLFGPHGGIHVLGLRFDDRGEKFLTFRELARRVESTGAKAVMFIGEAWWTRVLAPPSETSPSRAKEILSLTLISQDGEEFTLWKEFRREPEGIEFGPLHEGPASETHYLRPVRRVWTTSKERKEE